MDMRQLVEAALAAPSGGNFQPWRLLVRDGDVRQYSVPERTAGSYALRGRDLLSHGVLIESLSVAATVQRRRARVNLFPEPKDPEQIARIEMEEADVPVSPLAACLAERVSNRKPYRPEPLRREHYDELTGVVDDGGACELRIVEEPAKIAAIARAASLNEILGLENQVLHGALIGHLRFTQEEHEMRRDGLYLRTLEMPAPAEFLFRHLFRRWGAMRVLRRLGVPAQVGRQVEEVCRASAAYGAIVVGSRRDQDFIAAGRLLQRLWLTATKLGVSLQPTTGTLLFMQRLLDGEETEFTAEEKGRIRAAYDSIASAFGVTEGSVVLAFRLGYGDPPSARALRYPVEKVVQFAEGRTAVRPVAGLKAGRDDGDPKTGKCQIAAPPASMRA